MDVRNTTVFPHFRFEKMGTEGEPFDVIVVRGTFVLPTGDGPLTLAETQDPVCFADEYDGPAETDPLKAVMRREGDLVMFKPTTDVHVIGRARPPGGEPAAEWLATAQLGPVHKTLRLTGPREFHREGTEWRLTLPTPVESVPLDYRFAFGGTWSLAPEDWEGDAAVDLSKADNPSGIGWLPSEADLERIEEPARDAMWERVQARSVVPAPQIEDADAPITSPFDEVETAGFGPLARWWAPRLAYAGTWDDAWRNDVRPRFPDDFDTEFYQSAHPDLIAPDWLEGDERLDLEGLFPEGPVVTELPGHVLVAAGIRESGEEAGGRLQLDTVCVDLDRRVVSLTWRGAFSKVDPVRFAEIGDVTVPVGEAEAPTPQEAAPHG